MYSNQQDINSDLQATRAAEAASQAADMAGWQAALPAIENDIATDNYLGAIKTAETTDNSATSGGTPTANPLLQMLETSQGLNELDPSKQWSETDTAAYYKAFTDPSVYNANLLGQNPYGDWGDPTKSAQDALANFNADPNAAPNVVQYAGAKPRASFLDKYGGDIAALVITAATLGAGAEVGAGIIAATGAESALAVGAADVAGGALVGAGTGALEGAISGGNVGEDALLGAVGGGATSAVPLAGNALGNATGLGTTASDALAGGAIKAGTGALGAAVTGGNVTQSAELGAISGGVQGAVQGSGASGAIKGDLGNVTGSQTAGNLLGGAVTGLATSAITGLAGSALTSSSGKGAAASGSIAGSLGNVSGSSTSTATSKGTTTTLSPGVTPITNQATTPATFTSPGATSASRGGQVFTDDPTPTTGWGSSFSVGG